MSNLRFLRFVAGDTAEGLGRVGGLLAAFTGPDRLDAYGNYWTRETDFRLDEWKQRPAYIDHATRSDMTEAAGRVDDASLAVMDDGLYGEAIVSDNRAGRELMRMVERGVAFWSTAVLPHMMKFADDGRVLSWPFVEASVTAKPATWRGETRVSARRNQSLAFGPIWEVDEVDETPVVNEDGGGVDVAAFVAAVETLTHTVEGLETTLSRRSLPDAPHPSAFSGLTVTSTPWPNVSLGAMLFWHQVNSYFGAMRGKRGPGRMFDNTFYRAVLDKANKARSDDEARVEKLLAEGQRPRTWMRSVDQTAVQDWHKVVPYMRSDEAMQSDLTNYGDELVPTMLSSVAWRDMVLESKIVGLFDDFDMPSNPFDYPTITSDPVMALLPEFEDQAQASPTATNIADSKIGTGKVTFTAAGLGGLVLYSEVLLEDAGIDFVQEMYIGFERSAAQAADYAILNGDTTATTGNISHYGTDPTAVEAYNKILAFLGLRKIAFAASDTVADTAVDANITILVGQLMGTAGRYGADPRKCVLLVDHAVYYALMALDALASVSDIGPHALLLTGMIGSLRGVPVILPDTNVYEGSNASGYYEDSHDTVLGSYTMVRPELFKVGRRRGFELRSSAIPGTTGNMAWGTFRIAFQKFAVGGAAVGYNVGGS